LEFPTAWNAGSYCIAVPTAVMLNPAVFKTISIWANRQLVAFLGAQVFATRHILSNFSQVLGLLTQ